MNGKTKIIFLTLISLIGADQLSKHWIHTHIPIGEKITLFPKFLDIVHYRNTGAAFGMLSDWASPWRELFFFAISVFALSFLAYTILKTPAQDKKSLIPFLMILGGALGNIIDRVFRGSVVDFILFHWDDRVVSFSLAGHSYAIELVWPAFNIADSAITLGVTGLLLVTLFTNHKKKGSP